MLNKQIAELTNKINSFKNEKEEFENKIKSSDKHIKWALLNFKKNAFSDLVLIIILKQSL